MSTITGLYAVQTSSSNPLKLSVWPKLLSILRGAGDKLMIDLLLDCGIFQYTDTNAGALLQISGVPITATASTKQVGSRQASGPASKTTKVGTLKPATSIHFLRSRILYGKPSLNANGCVHFGLAHIHVFNRYDKVDDPKQNLHVLKYVFPQSFKLHNPFTCEVDKRETAMRLKDYTMREAEITHASLKLHPKTRDRTPKRLVLISSILQRIRKRHSRCSYTQLLAHYCPLISDQMPLAESSGQAAGGRQVTDLATSHINVSQFCRAVMSKLLPADCLARSNDQAGLTSFEVLGKFIDKFVRLRKTETLSLYDLCRSMRLASFSWLRPPGTDPNRRLSKTDFDTRTLLLWQFLYFVVDSILMPLIRAHFHVTESNTDRLHLFYFRHDVWRQLTEPFIVRMRSSGHAVRPLQQGAVFSSYVSMDKKRSREVKLFRAAKFRLVPKRESFRLITNLGHREQVERNGKLVLGVSTNTKLWSLHQAMKAECAFDKTKLGSAMFNKGEIGKRLHDFQAALLQRGWQPGTSLYFAKVDIQSCFDSIPQDKALQLLQDILAAGSYNMQKYADVSPPSVLQYDKNSVSGALRSRYASHSTRCDQPASLVETDRPLVPYTVRTATAPVVTESQTRLHTLLRTHITQHTIRIGKKEYRQSQGVPQGSVISTLLCNFFYAKYEEQHLGFLRRPDTTMLRLIDDFLVISADRNVVKRFVDQMHAGNIDYGITVRASKTVLSWEHDLNTFPFCGLEIDTHTLQVLKHAGNKGAGQICDSLTVEHSREPGKVFHRKMLK